jgi:CubicO group peptidase (beta-lactamase class C family)
MAENAKKDAQNAEKRTYIESISLFDAPLLISMKPSSQWRALMLSNTRFCSFLCAILLLSQTAHAVDEKLAPLFSKSGLPGYCGVSQNPTSSRKFAAGIAQRAPDQAYRTTSLQPVGSVSKPFIGMALAQLSVDGVLDLDADINGYLPWSVRNPNVPETPITLRQLASHTSGILDRAAAYRDSYWRTDQTATPESLEQFLASYFQATGKRYRRSNFSRSAPGETYAYSNMGSALAALVVERQSKMAFSDYVRVHILTPLKMRQSSYARPETAALLYHANGKEVPRYRLLTYPDGGLYSSCEELQLFLQAVLSAHLAKTANSTLDPRVVAEMLAPQWRARPSDVPDAISNHGLFWEIRGERYGHTGGDPGVSAIIAIEPKLQRTRVQLSNVDIDERRRLREGFIALWQALGE